MSNVHLSSCPICGSNSTETYLLGKDFSVSKEEYSVLKCTDCSFAFTQNAPDKAHIGKYYKSEDYVSHSDTKKGLFFKAYHMVRSIMLKRKAKLIQKHTGKTKGKILDVGCGTGYFPSTMKEHGWDVLGIEQDDETRQYAIDKFQIEAKGPDSIKELEEGSFDCITLWHVLEHLHDLNESVEQYYKLLKPEGVLIIAVPNHECFEAKIYEKYWAGWDIPIHLWHFSIQSMKKLMSKHNFSVSAIKGMPFDPFYISLISEKYRKGNSIRGLFMGFLAMLAGLISKPKSSSLIYIIRKSTFTN
jgi:2-polyprenyl-3-methyl-5-hydroxy-6-metoxy-1,4-benzoquinol methylase